MVYLAIKEQRTKRTQSMRAEVQKKVPSRTPTTLLTEEEEASFYPVGELESLAMAAEEGSQVSGAEVAEETILATLDTGDASTITMEEDIQSEALGVNASQLRELSPDGRERLHRYHIERSTDEFLTREDDN